MCLIDREKDNKFKLYLFQISKNKTQELQTNYYYLSQADYFAQNLEELYNINITDRYLIFILPTMSDTTQFIEELQSNNYFYIFYDSSTRLFYNKNKEELHGLDFEESLLKINTMTEVKDSEKIKQNNFIWENSMKAFINKKRTEKKSFYQIYINNYYNFNRFNQIKLNLSNTLKDSLLKDIICQKDAILKFIGNCKLKNIESIKNLYKMIIIFKNDEQIIFNMI